MKITLSNLDIDKFIKLNQGENFTVSPYRGFLRKADERTMFATETGGVYDLYNDVIIEESIKQLIKTTVEYYLNEKLFYTDEKSNLITYGEESEKTLFEYEPLEIMKILHKDLYKYGVRLKYSWFKKTPSLEIYSSSSKFKNEYGKYHKKDINSLKIIRKATPFTEDISYNKLKEK